MSDKAWGGRFEEELDAIAARFSASVDVDGRLWPPGHRGLDRPRAHARRPKHPVRRTTAEQIVAGLETIGEFDRSAASSTGTTPKKTST